MRRRKGRGEITHINTLFAKYQKTLQAPEKTVIKTFIEIIDDLYGWRLNDTQVRYSVPTRTISCSVAGPLKQELRFKEKEIITHLKGRLGDKNHPNRIA